MNHDYTVKDGAIHVYENSETAKELAASEALKHCNTLVIPVKCYIKDLIAVGIDSDGYNTEAYSQVYVEQLPCA